MLMGIRVKEAREKLNLSQEQLGDMIGVSKVSICGYEKETRVPSLDVFIDLAQALDVDIKYLLGQELSVISENKDYSIKMCRDDIKIINEIKRNRQLYNALIMDAPRTIKLINKKLYD